MTEVTIVGGGLAGSEAALQLADRGVPVRLYEMRPEVPTGAHRTGALGEIVCSNSFKSKLVETASGLLKAEMDVLGCHLLEVARAAAVPAGHALGIDRELFSTGVTERIEAHPDITVVREAVDTLDVPLPAVIATGPLTGEKLAGALATHCSSEHLYFYDAIAPSIDGDSLGEDAGFWASRYDKGDGDDYLNVPLDPEQYAGLLAHIRGAEYADTHAFEEEKYFEACLPIEVLASRGDDTLRYGPMKPKGLTDPRTGREPWAAIQLRQESREGSLLGLVGFQTRMKWPDQKAMLQLLPGFEDVRVLRYGTIHRNIFLDVPRLCRHYMSDRQRDGLYFAGQICGVEGYVESIMSAIVVSLSIFARLHDRDMPAIPGNTMIGALMEHVHGPTDNFQPMNANMGIVPRPAGLRRGRGGRRARNEAISAAAIEAIKRWREAHAWLFPA